MRKRTTICVLSVFLFSTCTALFSQVTEIALLTPVNFASFPQPVFFDIPSAVPSNSIASTEISDNSDAVVKSPDRIADDETFAMQSAISNFFNAFGTGKTDCLKESCTVDVAFKTHLQDQTGNHHIFDESIDDLIPFVSKSGTCFNINVQYELLSPDPSSMQFRAPYTFYINDQVSHCGVCTFELEKVGMEWKIKQMIDTRSRSCK